VLEQIPKFYPQVIERISKSCTYAIFIEAFREAQLNVFQKMHLRNVDYFRYSYKEFQKYFIIQKFFPLEYSKIKYNRALAVCISKNRL